MKYTIAAHGAHPAISMDICCAQPDDRSLRCLLDPDHNGDHASAYGLFWADGCAPYRLGPNQRRGDHGRPEPI